MKKNMNIIISGIIFHIEEDGYDKLKEYLDNIHRYFASYNNSSEVISDIENRIAEIFLNKLGQGVQVINMQDLETLMANREGIINLEVIKYSQL